MQRRMLSLLAVCCTAVVGIAAAQTPSARFGLGGGVIIPVGNYKDADKIGWHGLGMAQFGLPGSPVDIRVRSEEHTSELQSPCNLVCRLLLEKKKKNMTEPVHIRY